jgi:hypothetical protein
MDDLTLIITPDELRGLSALIELDGPSGARQRDGIADADVLSQARALMREALADELAAASLPWAPSSDAVRQQAAQDAKRARATARLTGDQALRKGVASALAVAGLVVLAGGYAGGWKWTGFQENGQVWDWLNLLLLPVVIGTIPLWITDRDYIGKGRRIIFRGLIAAFAVFVLAGYLVPISWAGFSGQKLWDWIGLLVLPAALAATAALASRGTRYQGQLLRPWEWAIAAALTAGWLVTVIGGYALRWTWTGYSGNTLWDWLQVLLAPAAFPTIMLPFLVTWVSGNAAGRAAQAREAPAAPGTVPPD